MLDLISHFYITSSYILGSQHVQYTSNHGDGLIQMYETEVPTSMTADLPLPLAGCSVKASETLVGYIINIGTVRPT